MAESFFTPRKKKVHVLAVLSGMIGCFLPTPQAHAQFVPFTAPGNIIAADDVQSTVFTVTQTQNSTFYTTSYAEGTNADNTVSTAGGFDPILTLFDSNGNTIDFNYDGTTGFVNTDLATGLTADSYMTEMLTPGSYRLGISEYDSFALSDFFDYTEAGNSTFTSQFSDPFNPLLGPLLDPTGTQRTVAYTYDFVASPNAMPPTAVPKPSTALSLLSCMFVVCLAMLRRRFAGVGMTAYKTSPPSQLVICSISTNLFNIFQECKTVFRLSIGSTRLFLTVLGFCVALLIPSTTAYAQAAKEFTATLVSVTGVEGGEKGWTISGSFRYDETGKGLPGATTTLKLSTPIANFGPATVGPIFSSGGGSIQNAKFASPDPSNNPVFGGSTAILTLSILGPANYYTEGTCPVSGVTNALPPGYAGTTLYAGFIVITSTSSPDQTGKTLGNHGGPFVGEPISVASGNVYDQVTDYQTAGTNNLSFTRFYNSRNTINNTSTTLADTLGTNWRSNFDRYLYLESSSLIVAERADGQFLTFTGTGSTWTGDSDSNEGLTQSGSTWAVSGTDGTVETYSTVPSMNEAILISIQYRDGYSQTLNYNSSNQVTSVTDSYNRTLGLSYQNGLLQTVTTPDGLTLTYGYDSSGQNGLTLDRLTSVKYSTTPQTGISYLHENPNFPFAITAIIDENGNRYMSWTYDQYARGLTSQFGNGANLTKVSYNDTDGSRTVTTALGEVDTYKFATVQGIPKVTEIDRAATTTAAAGAKGFTYDSNGYLASRTDWNGNLTIYLNDRLGRPTTIVEASGTPLARTTSLAYYGGSDLPTQIVAPNLTSAFTYDSNQELLTKTLMDTTTLTVPYPTKGQIRTWTYTWVNGLLTSALSPRTDVTALTLFVYDSSGTLVKTTNALGQIVQVTQHLPGGLPLTFTDANGVTSQFTYDARQRLTSSAISTTTGPLTTHYTYDPAGNLLTVTLPNGSATTRSYDTAHRQIGITDLLGQTVAYTVDAAGDRTQTNIANAVGTVLYHHASSYDALGQLMTDTGGAGQQTDFAYDANGNTLTITDPLTHVHVQTFDALNRLLSLTDSTSGVTTTTYDTQDHPKTVTPPNNGKTIYTYDGFGEVTETSSPDTHNTVYLYDPDGNLTEKIDATRAIVNYTYDALDRVTAATYPADAPENVTYIYDQPGSGFGVGRLTFVKDAVGTLGKTYDERGNVLSEVRGIGPATLTTTYSYDAAGRVTGITYPSGYMAFYVRDVMGRPTSVTLHSPGYASTQSVVSQIAYEPFGPISSLAFGNGITEARTFDGDYRMTGIADAGTATVQSLAYSYDAADNVQAIGDGVTSGNNQSFLYDALDRLTQVSGGYGTLAYTYDHMGNRLTQGNGSATAIYTYTPATNQLAAVTSGGARQTVGYTLAGNISAFSFGPVSALTYNQAGRLALVKSGSQSVAQYGYDAFGERLMKSSSAGSTLYHYDQQGHMLEETAANGSASADYLYLNGRLIATLTPSTGSLNYIHADRLGTPQLATNSTQAVVWSAAYQPYGLANASGSITQNLRLPGQYADAETGWYQNGFRDYVPGLGRYLESDPIGLGGGLNSYAYAGGNPLKNIDPTGTDIIVFNKLVHEYIQIETSQGTTTFGFGPENPGAIYGAGEIDEGDQGNGYARPGGTPVSIQHLSPQDGNIVAMKIRNMQAYPPPYGVVGFNCNNFANVIVDSASHADADLNSKLPLDLNIFKALLVPLLF